MGLPVDAMPCLGLTFFLFASPPPTALSAEVKDDRAPVFCPISKAKFSAATQ